jgi:hypothetical protein
MSNQKKTFYVFLALSLVVVFMASQKVVRRPHPDTAAVPEAASLPVHDDATTDAGSEKVERTVASNEEVSIDKQFARWFATEAGRIESRDTDSLASEAELKERAQKFTRQEITYLADRATSSSSSAAERILASYLLGLSGETSSEALVDIASQPVKNPGPHPADSVAEKQAVQERAYKIMAVDAIFNSESEISQKIKKLQSIVNQTPDTTVKHYASDKVDELRDTY